MAKSAFKLTCNTCGCGLDDYSANCNACKSRHKTRAQKAHKLSIVPPKPPKLQKPLVVRTVHPPRSTDDNAPGGLHWIRKACTTCGCRRMSHKSFYSACEHCEKCGSFDGLDTVKQYTTIKIKLEPI